MKEVSLMVVGIFASERTRLAREVVSVVSPTYAEVRVTQDKAQESGVNPNPKVAPSWVSTTLAQKTVFVLIRCDHLLYLEQTSL
jgi:hypothetical protein